METYQALQRKALGAAFVLGPLLLTLGAAVFLLGIERSPDGTSSRVEGVLMAFGFLGFVPVYFELARRLGERAPRFGIFCAITGLWYPAWRSLALLATIGTSLLGVVAMGLRLRRARGDERQQLKWLTYFLATAVSVQLLVFELPGAFY